MFGAGDKENRKWASEVDLETASEAELKMASEADLETEAELEMAFRCFK